MNEEAKTPETVEPWNVFVLAACARLGPFPQVHLAPKLTSKELGVAVRANLPFAPSEFLVAVVESTSGGFPCPVLLSNRRMYWFVRTDRGPGADPNASAGPTIHCEGVDYALLGTHIEAQATAAAGMGLNLGEGRLLPLPDATPELAVAMAEVLQNLGTAARSGITPSIEQQDPELARRITSVIPQVVEVSNRLRLYGGDLAMFRDDLMAATPNVFITPMLIIFCVLIYVLMVVSGVSPMTPTTHDLLTWGANDGGRVVLHKEYWRLPASVFLHGGLLHLAVNMWCLMNIGPMVERFYGNLGYLFLYLAAGIGGAVASMAMPPVRVSVGASGAIFGILGALLAFLIVRRRAVPATVLAPLRSSALSFVIFNTLFGAVVPVIDQSAHMGGLATGFLVGLILSPPWPRKQSIRGIVRAGLLCLVAALILTAAGAGAVHWRETTITAVDKVRDFGRQLQPPYERFLETAQANVEVAKLLDQREDASARSILASMIESLTRQGKDNLSAIARIQTPEPRLQEVTRLLESAQKAQIAGLEAAKQYEATGDRVWIDGPEGFIAKASAAVQHEQECQKHQVEYLRDHGLIQEAAEAETEPKP